MADAAQPLLIAGDLTKNIVREMKAITSEQDKQLTRAKNLNIENQLLVELKNTHLKNDVKLVTLQTSIVNKIQDMVKIEGEIAAIRKLGTAATAAQLLMMRFLEADISRYKKEIKEAVKEHNVLLVKMAMMNSLLEIANKTGFEGMIKFTKELRDNWASHPILGIKTLLLKAIDVFNVLDQSAAKFRQQMGFTREFTKNIDANAREIAFNFAHIGVDAEKVYEATQGIGENLFSSMSATKDMVRDISILSAQLGITAEDSTEFMKSMGMVSQTSAGAQANMAFFTSAMTEAAGVPLGAVMQDIATATKNSYQFVSRTGTSLIKAAVEARRMGTSLQSATQTGRSLLNFTENVKDEMEASVLLGKSLNLQKARELAYHKDIRGLNNEILKIIKETNFENLDPLQQDAVARTLGKSASELGQMAQAERERQNWEKSTDPLVQKQLKAYKEMMNMTESIAKQRGEDMRLQLQAKANQAAITSITQSWNAILNRIGEAVLPAIEMTLRAIAYGVGGINRLIGWFNGAAEKLGKTWGTIAKFISGAAVAAVLLVGSRGLGKLASWVTGGIGKGIGDMLGGVTKGFAKINVMGMLKGAAAIALLGVSLFIFAKAVKPLSEIQWKGIFIGALALAAFATIAGIMGAPPIVGFILMGSLAIAALGLALIPFAGAAWIASKALQNLSTVKWGDIAKGIFQVGMGAPLISVMGLAMLSAAPGIAAFSLALIPLSLIANKAGTGMMNLGTGMKMITSSLAELQNLSFIGTILQIKNLSSAIRDLSKAITAMPDISIEKLKAIAMAGTGGVAATKEDQTSKILQDIKDAIDGLRNDFKNGSITSTVYIDTQKLDSLMGRRLAYTGQLV